MDNHVHLIAVPDHADAMARTMRQTHADYARYANVKRRSTGHFWQNRYFSCALDKSHCWQALAYVEKNPVRAGMAAEAAEWRWSSARAHLGDTDAARGLDFDDWRKTYSPDQWGEVLRTTVADEAQAERIREASRTGRPLGEKDFVTEMEHRLRRPLRVCRPGRPPRNPLSERAHDVSFSQEEIGL